MSDAIWAHGPVIEMFDKILTWMLLPVTVVLLVWNWVVNWRTGEKYFWRQVCKQASAIFIGGGLAFLLVVIVKWSKGDALEIEAGGRAAILIIFSVVGLLILLARYKFRNSSER